MLKSRLEKHYEKVVLEDFLILYNYKNINSLPRMEHLIFHSTSKSFSIDENALLESFSTILLGTGSRPKMSKAHKSIAQFSVRKDNILGVRVTLRKKRLFNLLEKLLVFVIPSLLKSRRFEIQKKKRVKVKKDDLLQDTQTKSFSISGKDTKAFPEIEILLLFFSYFTGFDLTSFFSNGKSATPTIVESALSSNLLRRSSINKSSEQKRKIQNPLLEDKVVVIEDHRFSEDMLKQENNNTLPTKTQRSCVVESLSLYTKAENTIFSYSRDKQRSNHLNSLAFKIKVKKQWLSAFQLPYNIKL